MQQKEQSIGRKQKLNICPLEKLSQKEALSKH